MRRAMASALCVVIAASSVGCLNESIQLGREDEDEGAGAGAGAGVCPGGASTCVDDSVTPAGCGDGIVQGPAGESCDDGGRANGDGCSSTCRIERHSRIVDISIDAVNSCALNEDGRVKCWGYNMEGALGLEDQRDRGGAPGTMGANLPFVDFGTGQRVVSLGIRSDGSCVLLSDGHVKCWGHNDVGQLGTVEDSLFVGDEPGEMGDNLPTVDLGTGRTAVSIAKGASHTCALLDDGHVKCWGMNFSGELGLGDKLNRGDDPNEMGDNLPTVDLGTGGKAVALSASRVHTCALLDDGHVKCWGNNDAGRLGLGDKLARGDDPDDMGDNLPVVDLGQGKKAIAVAAGSWHTCALLEGGLVKCWGFNDSGENGVGNVQPYGGNPGDMGDNLPAVDLGTGRTAVAITGLSQATCALLDNGHVKCWGNNEYGKLGLGDLQSRGGKPGDMGDNLPEVDLGTGRTALVIRGGYYHACAVLDDHSVKCWGGGGFGRLGLDDQQDRGDNPKEMGDNLPAVDL
jgi:cysteine-rich repeat protein